MKFENLKRRDTETMFPISKGTTLHQVIKNALNGAQSGKVAKWRVLRAIASDSIVASEAAGREVTREQEQNRDIPYEIGGGVMALYAYGVSDQVINFGRAKPGLGAKTGFSGPAIAFILNGGKLTLIGGAAEFIAYEVTEEFLAKHKLSSTVVCEIGGYLLDTEGVSNAATREVSEEWGDLGPEIAQKLGELVPTMPGHYLIGIENYLKNASPNPNYVTAGSFIRKFNLGTIMPVERICSSLLSGKAMSSEGKVVFLDFGTLNEYLEIEPDGLFSIHADYLRVFLSRNCV